MKTDTGRAPNATERIAPLDGLRGVLIVWVVSTHFLDDFRPVSGFDRALLAVDKAGWLALEGFFALSGYLITSILWDTRGTRRYLSTFYARRLLRIVPVYYGFLLGLVFWITQLNAPDPGEARAFLDRMGWYWTFSVNGLIAMRDRWTIAPFNTAHFWSLSVEEQFYMLWPLCVMRLSRERLVQVCVGAFVFSVALRTGLSLADVSRLRIYVATPARLDSLALGSLMALVARGPDGFRRILPWLRPAGLASLAGIAAIGVQRGELSASDPFVQCAGFALIAVASAALIAHCVARREGLLPRVLDQPSLRRLGRYSYAMYVVHYPVVYVMKRSGLSIPRLTGFVASLHGGVVIFFTLAMTISIVLAALSWHLSEKHILAQRDEWFPIETR